jgi:sigma54-dependent transcription regulator
VASATTRDLHEVVAAGTFRADLHYRVNVFDIQIPPLRDRGEDVMPLAESSSRTSRVLATDAGSTLTPLAAAARVRITGRGTPVGPARSSGPRLLSAAAQSPYRKIAELFRVEEANARQLVSRVRDHGSGRRRAATTTVSG